MPPVTFTEEVFRNMYNLAVAYATRYAGKAGYKADYARAATELGSDMRVQHDHYGFLRLVEMIDSISYCIQHPENVDPKSETMMYNDYLRQIMNSTNRDVFRGFAENVVFPGKDASIITRSDERFARETAVRRAEDKRKAAAVKDFTDSFEAVCDEFAKYLSKRPKTAGFVITVDAHGTEADYRDKMFVLVEERRKFTEIPNQYITKMMNIAKELSLIDATARDRLLATAAARFPQYIRSSV